MFVKLRFCFPEFAFGILFAVALFATGAVFGSSSVVQPSNGPVQTINKQESKEKPANTAKNDGPDDRIARYTWWLAILNACLVVASVGQGYFLIRSDKTATESNRQSRELFAADQRPWINLSNPKIRISDDENSLRFAIDGKNIGKTPAFAVEVRAKAFKSQIALPSVDSVKKFARTLNAASEWKDSRRAIFPDISADLSVFDSVEIDSLKGGDTVRITYCVTYFANGDPKIYRTAGEVIFNIKSIDSADNIEGDWFSVSSLINDIGVTYAD